MIKDFTRIMPKKGCEEWIKKLGEMSALFSNTEYETIKRGLRRIAIIRVSPDNLNLFLEKINKDRLLFTPVLKVAESSSFSILNKSIKPGDPFSWEGFLSRNNKDAQKFKKYYLENDHIGIGEMLDYPKCCTDHFIRTFLIDPCPIWEGVSGKVKGYPESNRLIRYFGPVITAHISCSPDCKETKKMGKEWFKIMKNIDSKLADEMYQLLAGPMVWNSYHGVVQVETPYFIGLNSAYYIPKEPRIIEWLGEIKEKTPRNKKLKRKK
ncbi:MAG: hypothetical protein LRZ94_00975 [Candidatus Pacebacteria bacterium]|nr:hypothetical protein [Candidatus Paceibacterota bacterium]